MNKLGPPGILATLTCAPHTAQDFYVPVGMEAKVVADGIHVTHPDWEALSIAGRLGAIRSLLEISYRWAAFTGLRWSFSDLSLDREDIAFALSYWDSQGVPILSLIALQPVIDGIASVGLAAITGNELAVRCDAEHRKAVTIFAAHAAYHLLGGQDFSTGQHLVSEDLLGFVLEHDVDARLFRLALITNPIRTEL